MARDGESGLLDRIRARLGPAPAGEVWAGDDAAVVHSPGAELLFTTDMLVEGVDFDLGYCTGYDIGWKAVHVNASDIAAMGGRPTHGLSTLSLPGSTELAFVDDLIEGFLAAARSMDVALVGGDLSGAGAISVNVALIGTTDGRAPVLRSAARPGEALCVTGRLGGARGGLEILRGGLRDDWSGGSELAGALERLANRHLRPSAQVRTGPALARIGASAMIDVSDGLVLDLSRLMSASDTGCRVDPEAVPLDPDLEAVVAAGLDDALPDPLGAALTGGEDFELLFSIDESLIDEVATSSREAGTTVTRIGTVTDGAPMIGGRELASWEEPGWDHLRRG